MQLKYLNLKNFRCYKSLSVSFHPQLTVLVAINGEGKTSVLDALRIGFWSFVSQFDLARTAYSDPANTITIDDVRSCQFNETLAGSMQQMARQLPCEVQLECELDDKVFQWTRIRKSESRR